MRGLHETESGKSWTETPKYHKHDGKRGWQETRLEEHEKIRSIVFFPL